MYKFKPITKTLVWGTESWVLSGVPGNESVVAEGPLAGKKITDIYPGQFPLLIKFIDANADLSIQVHPDDTLAAQRHNCKGKTEMWYIIDAKPGAHLLSGLKEQIDPQKYVELVEQDKIVDVLADYKVQPGDVFFLPAGRIHAIGAGCYLAEIQQTSDITYRIYDYGRLGLDGKPRQLHTQEAKDAIDYTVSADYRTHYEPKKGSAVQLVSCPLFKTDLVELEPGVPVELPVNQEFLIVMGLGGSATLRVGTETLELTMGEAVLIPSEDGTVSIASESGAKLLTTCVPTR